MTHEAGEAALEPSSDERRTRRAFLTVGAAGAAAVAAAAMDSLVNPLDAAAASIVLGGTNSTTKPTVIRNTKAAGTAKAIIGRTTYTGGALNAAGVQGIADGTNASGVWGTANKGPDASGVYGSSTTGSGVYGSAPTGVLGVGIEGVVGLSGTEEGAGVFGIASDACLDGVAGVSETTDGAGLYGMATDGWAAYLDGAVFITDDVYFPAAFVQVDHPTDPENRWYRQALVGSYEQVSVLSGNVTTNANGRATVEVPRIFERTHRDFRYQLTPIGKAAGLHVARELDGGRFVIDAGAPGVRVSWQLTGERSDPSARRHRVDVEAPKVGASRGRYLEPGLYGQPRSSGLRRRGAVHRAALRRRLVAQGRRAEE
jgi:hypothetical protein